MQNRNKGHQQWNIVRISVDIDVQNGRHFLDPKQNGEFILSDNSK